MTPEARANLIRKIRKCLALAASANPHEAAAAMRQAQAMMAAANVTDDDLAAAEACAADARATSGARPPRWEQGLCGAVCDAFGVDVVFRAGRPAFKNFELRRGAGTWIFIGTGAAPEVSTYAFTVCLRLITKARAAYRATLKGIKAATKLKRCDLFCLGWVHQIRKHLDEFAAPTRNERAIAAYKLAHFGQLKDMANKSAPAKINNNDASAFAGGMAAAKDVRLQNGVGATAAPDALTQVRALEQK